MRALKCLTLLSIAVLVGCGSNIPNVRYPITSATGKYTVRTNFFWAQGDSSAAELADQLAEVYRRGGQDAYVTDLGNRAILSVGSFESRNDPRLIATWRKEYAKYQKLHGGTDSTFQQQLDRFHEDNRALGDRPYPESIELLQMKMKRVRGEISREQYLEFLEEYRKRGPQ